MTARERWRMDRAAYGSSPWLKDQSIWLVAVLRFGEWADELARTPLRRAASAVYWLAYRAVQTALGIGLSREVTVGGGLRIHHFGGIFVAGGVRIGERCVLRQGVTIGNRAEGGPVPVLGDDVELGAYAQVLGGITIGDGAKVGAMAVVLQDVPAGATAVGNPARIIERRG